MHDRCMPVRPFPSLPHCFIPSFPPSSLPIPLPFSRSFPSLSRVHPSSPTGGGAHLSEGDGDVAGRGGGGFHGWVHRHLRQLPDELGFGAGRVQMRPEVDAEHSRGRVEMDAASWGCVCRR